VEQKAGFPGWLVVALVIGAALAGIVWAVIAITGWGAEETTSNVVSAFVLGAAATAALLWAVVRDDASPPGLSRVPDWVGLPCLTAVIVAVALLPIEEGWFPLGGRRGPRIYQPQLAALVGLIILGTALFACAYRVALRPRGWSSVLGGVLSAPLLLYGLWRGLSRLFGGD
jgi:hypothetical protein